MKLTRQVIVPLLRRPTNPFTVVVFVGLMVLIIGLLTNPARP